MQFKVNKKQEQRQREVKTAGVDGVKSCLSRTEVDIIFIFSRLFIFFAFFLMCVCVWEPELEWSWVASKQVAPARSQEHRSPSVFIRVRGSVCVKAMAKINANKDNSGVIRFSALPAAGAPDLWPGLKRRRDPLLIMCCCCCCLLCSRSWFFATLSWSVSWALKCQLMLVRWQANRFKHSEAVGQRKPKSTKSRLSKRALFN